MKKLSICLLISGNLGYSLLKYLSSKTSVKIHSVFTDKKSDVLQAFCSDNKIYCFVGNPRNNKSESFRNNIKDKPDIVLSINYLFLIENDLITYPKSYAINVHGSLLPKYRGRTPHVWAIINNEKETGITAHIITTECDKGDIIAQKVIPITKEDTGGSILEKYKESYPLLIDEVISKVQSGNVETKKQDESKATYYPKRTPDDGEIDWNWQKERIYNWVRAMAPPDYPGAFFFYEGQKIIVKKLELSEMGFPLGTENGTVIEHTKDSFIIKTPNGCVKVFRYVDF